MREIKQHERPVCPVCGPVINPDPKPIDRPSIGDIMFFLANTTSCNHEYRAKQLLETFDIRRKK